MYYKNMRYEKAKASTLASTHKVELPESGLVDSILMYLRATTAADLSSLASTNMHKHLTKIEVIANTDKILFSLTAEEALAKAYRKIGTLPPFKQCECNSQTQDMQIPIFFGRKYKDGKYALDLSKWDKVELQVTNDFTTSYITDSLSMETRLVTLEDSVETHAKFLKQWEYVATVPNKDASYVKEKLPSSGLLRSLMIQLDPALTAVTGACAEDPAGDNYIWKLYLKDRALTIYDHRPRDLMRDEHMKLGIGHSAVKAYPSTTKFFDLHWAEVLAAATGPVGMAGANLPAGIDDNRDRFQNLTYIGNTVSMCQVKAMGIGLFHTFEIPFYDKDEETEYFNLASYTPVETEIYAHKDDFTYRVILEKPIGQGPSEFA